MCHLFPIRRAALLLVALAVLALSGCPLREDGRDGGVRDAAADAR